MMPRRSIAVLTAALLLAATGGRAQEAGTAAAPYLLQDYGTVAASVGGAATGGPFGNDAIFYNPAALGVIPRKTLTLQHIEDVTGDNYELIAYSQPVGEKFGIGLSAQFVYFIDAVRDEFETIQEFTNYDLNLSLSLGYRVNSRIAIGGTAKYLKERLFIFEANTAAFDLGVLYQTPIRGLSLGFAKKDMGRGLRFIEDRFPLPKADRFGLAYQKPGYPWRVTADAVHVSEQSLRVGYGLSREIGKYLVMRGGYRHNYDGREASGFTAGLSVRYDNVAFDYAYIPTDDPLAIGGTHRVQSMLEFGQYRAYSDTMARFPVIGPPPRPILAYVPSSKFRGTMGLGSRVVDIDNDKIIGLAPGPSYAYNIYAVGSIGPAEATFGADMYFDQWDHYVLRTGSLALTAEDVSVVAGDFVADMSPYTIANRRMRGGEASYTIERAIKDIVPPSGADLRGVTGAPINVGEYLRKRGVGREVFQSTTIRALAGQTERAVNVGDDLLGLNGVKSTYGVFEQFSYGAEVATELQPGLSLSLRAAHVADDPNSLHTAGVTDPLINSVISAGTTKLFGTGNLSWENEIAYSMYDLDQLSAAAESKNDLALRTRVNWARGKWDLMGGWESIGSDFDLGGNLSMKSLRDRKGPKWRIEATPSRRVTIQFGGEYYRDNLKAAKLLTVKTTKIDPVIVLSLPRDLSMTIGYSARTDRSDRSKDPASVLQRVNSASEAYRITAAMPIGTWAVSGNLSTSNVRNNNIYLPGTVIGGYRLKTIGANIGGPISDKSRFSGGYNRTELDFAVPPARSSYEQLNGRVDYTGMFGRLDVFAAGRWNLNKGSTQKENRSEYALGGRSMIRPGKTLAVEYKKVTDHYEPFDLRLGFNTHVLDVKYSGIF